jgi:muramoyltetrapeptide carboxypeptidase
LALATFRIGVVAPAGRFSKLSAERAQGLAALRPGRPIELVFHPQCFHRSGHFAGTDAERSRAVVETGNDGAIDAVWFARGGYGSNRIAEGAVSGLSEAALKKPWLGYSDMGFLLGALFNAGATNAAHGPMVTDGARYKGAEPVMRALDWLVEGKADACEPEALKTASLAFNLSVLTAMLGTPLEPDFTGRVLMLEEVSEHHYRIDRMMFQLTSTPSVRRVSGLMLGRCSDIPENDPPFDQTEEEIARHWCEVSGVRYLGRADIGHDSANKVVPFR